VRTAGPPARRGGAGVTGRRRRDWRDRAADATPARLARHDPDRHARHRKTPRPLPSASTAGSASSTNTAHCPQPSSPSSCSTTGPNSAEPCQPTTSPTPKRWPPSSVSPAATSALCSASLRRCSSLSVFQSSRCQCAGQVVLVSLFPPLGARRLRWPGAGPSGRPGTNTGSARLRIIPWNVR
jgi:hypothetical protein